MNSANTLNLTDLNQIFERSSNEIVQLIKNYNGSNQIEIIQTINEYQNNIMFLTNSIIQKINETITGSQSSNSKLINVDDVLSNVNSSLFNARILPPINTNTFITNHYQTPPTTKNKTCKFLIGNELHSRYCNNNSYQDDYCSLHKNIAPIQIPELRHPMNLYDDVYLCRYISCTMEVTNSSQLCDYHKNLLQNKYKK